MNHSTDRGFRCSVCGEWHAELLTDIASKLPDPVWALDYLDAYRRARYNADFCTLDDNRYFIRCVLPVPFSYTDGFFGWGVWAEVAREHHDLYLAHFAEGSSLVAPFEGQLANNLKGYRKTLGLRLTVELSDEHRPFVRLHSSSRHALGLEQRRGISLERHHELVAPYV